VQVDRIESFGHENNYPVAGGNGLPPFYLRACALVKYYCASVHSLVGNLHELRITGLRNLHGCPDAIHWLMTLSDGWFRHAGAAIAGFSPKLL
jgi:hypothetical protein